MEKLAVYTQISYIDILNSCKILKPDIFRYSEQYYDTSAAITKYTSKEI